MNKEQKDSKFWLLIPPISFNWSILSFSIKSVSSIEPHNAKSSSITVFSRGSIYGKCRVCFPQLLHSPQNTGLGIVIHSKSEAGNWSLNWEFVYKFKWYDLFFQIFWIFDECSILKQWISNKKNNQKTTG